LHKNRSLTYGELINSFLDFKGVFGDKRIDKRVA